MYNIVIITDFPSISAHKQRHAFSFSELALLKEAFENADIDFATIQFDSILPRPPYGAKIESVWSLQAKHAKQFNYTTSKKGKAFYHPQIAKSLETFQTRVQTKKKSILVPLTDFALWALTGETSVARYRGSREGTNFPSPHIVIATYAPKQIFKMFEWKPYMFRDVQRIAEISQEQFEPKPPVLIVRPTFKEVILYLDWIISLPENTEVASDTETLRHHISCISLAVKTDEAICIPFLEHDNKPYFSYSEELTIVLRLKFIFERHRITGQNWSYDLQHIVRNWRFLPRSDDDTMLMAHALFPGMKKDLATLASLHCKDYRYWKDEHNDWHNLPEDLEQYWRYNAKDACYTLEIARAQRQLLELEDMVKPYQFLMRTQAAVNRVMIRGVAIDSNEKFNLNFSLSNELQARLQRLTHIAGTELNINSPKQLKEFFYDDLNQRPIKSRKTGAISTDSEALTTLARREPLLRPLTNLIEEARSIKIFLSTFVAMPLDRDGRMRCNYNVGGTETMRFSSSKNVFGSGGNLQNIPKGQEEEDGDGFKLPNLRRMFVPDPGYTLFDVDLAGADAQIVAWEAHDDDLKAKFRSGEKIHALNAKDMYGASAGADGKKAPYYKQAKMGTHLSNYGGRPATLSVACAMTIHEAEKFQRRWFEMHPGILEWHERIMNLLLTTRTVTNKFGFRRVYFNRPEKAFTEALAWIPQSTVALIINEALDRLEELRSAIVCNLQVHDSIVGQFPSQLRDKSIPVIRDALNVVVPYDDPLIIGTSLEISKKSWGDLLSCNWEDFT